MKRIVLSPLPIKLDKTALMEQNHIPADSDLAEEFSDLVDAAERVLCCKTILMDSAETNTGIPADIKPVLYYAMTIGTEIEADEDCDYPVLGDIVRQAALDSAMDVTQAYIKKNYGFENIKYFNPGSVNGWEQTANLSMYALLNAEEIGITCDERGYMKPWYSTLGVFTEV